MKMFYIICVLLLASITLNAQFSDFKAKSGLSKANEIASAELDNSMLVGLGAINFEKLAPESPLQLSFDESTGSAKMWVYFYANSENESEKTQIPLLNTFGQFVDVRTLSGEMDLDIVEFPFYELDTEFMDSDIFISTLSLNSDYLSLKSKYSESEFEFAGLTTNTEPGSGETNQPYWAIGYTSVEGEDSFDCYMNAKTGEVECEDANNTQQSVKYTLNKELKVYPQPANDEIIVNVNNKYNSFKIVDIFGNEIRLNSQKLLNGDLLNLDISTLSEGVYFLILENQTNKDVVKFVKN